MRDLRDAGVGAETVARLVRKGAVIRVARGLYELADAIPDTRRSIAEASALVPKGVICLTSALQFHELTLQMPSAVWIAIDRTGWKPKIEYPPILFARFSGRALNEGVKRYPIEGIEVPIFEPAKTIVDCFRYRNKIGLDIALEGLREGLRTKRATPDQIWEFAPHGPCLVGDAALCGGDGCRWRVSLATLAPRFAPGFSIAPAPRRLNFRFPSRATRWSDCSTASACRDHQERFVLKGAMLFAIWQDDPFRPTRDLDLLSRGDPDPATIAESIRYICSIAVPDDGVVFDIEGIEAASIRGETEYQGVRVRNQRDHCRRSPAYPDRYRFSATQSPLRQWRLNIPLCSRRQRRSYAPIHQKPSLLKRLRRSSRSVSPTVA